MVHVRMLYFDYHGAVDLFVWTFMASSKYEGGICLPSKLACLNKADRQNFNFVSCLFAFFNRAE